MLFEIKSDQLRCSQNLQINLQKKTNIKFHLNPTEKKEKIRKKLLRDLPQSLLIKRVSSTDIEIKKLRNKLSKMQKMNMCGFLHD